MAGCERMFEQLPDTFPPKRMMRGIEEIRANSARTLALLEAREQRGEAGTRRGSADQKGALRTAGTREAISPHSARAPEDQRRREARRMNVAEIIPLADTWGCTATSAGAGWP